MGSMIKYNQYTLQLTLNCLRMTIKKEQYKKDAERYTRKRLSKFIADKSKVVGDTILLEECMKYLKKLEETKQDKYTV